MKRSPLPRRAPRAPRSDRLVFGRPSIGEAEIAEVADSLRSGWLGRGPKVERSERDFAALRGAAHAVATHSCTAALQLALRAAVSPEEAATLDWPAGMVLRKCVPQVYTGGGTDFRHTECDKLLFFRSTTLFFGKINWVYGLFWYAALLFSSVVVLQAPLYLRRPLALGIIMTAVLVNLYLVQPVQGFEWLVPALFLKIVYGHIVREEPYRP